MSTHNICFHEEIKKMLCGYSLLSGALDMFCFQRISSLQNLLYFLPGIWNKIVFL